MSRNPAPYGQQPYGAGPGAGLPGRRPAPGGNDALFGNRSTGAPAPGGYGQQPMAPQQRQPQAMPPRAPQSQSQSEKPRGGSDGPTINLQLAKVEDKTLQVKLIYENV